MTLPISSEKAIKNSALVFIKPQANVESVQKLVKSHLENHVKIILECTVTGDRIKRKKLIDTHYYSIASKATLFKPEKMNVPAAAFEKFFNEKWQKVLSEKRAVNAMEALDRFNCTAAELETAWRESESSKKVTKFGGGFYCGKVTIDDTSLYVFNGFFLTMRDKFCDPDLSVHCFVVEWDKEMLPWKDFRSRVIGVTDPVEAVEGSVRREIYDRWEELGLDIRPSKADNAVHASASPFEGLVERVNWLSDEIIDDPYGKTLLSRGLTSTLLTEWFRDPQIGVPPTGKQESLFDYVEDTDAEECMDKLVEIYDYQLSLIKSDEGCKCGCPIS